MKIGCERELWRMCVSRFWAIQRDDEGSLLRSPRPDQEEKLRSAWHIIVICRICPTDLTSEDAGYSSGLQEFTCYASYMDGVS
jgi:hypothetical protein